MCLRNLPPYCLAALACELLTHSLPAQPPEFRAFWVDAFHPGFTNSAQVTQLIADTRAANCNALVVEVRRRGDAYYNSKYEPKAAGIDTNFDPLADLIAKGHDTSKGPRLEIHAWMTVYPVWRGADGSPPPDHPMRLHPDWLSRQVGGEDYDEHNYNFDPGHPAVQKYLCDVAMDLISRYDVDGFAFDRISYAGKKWGYNTNAVNRFNRRFVRTGQPGPGDPDWCQFRRDQVTALVRKVYLSAFALKPQLKISAGTIAWPPAPVAETQWAKSSAAYNLVLQDWRGWMEEGILDMNMPMMYYRQTTPHYATSFAQWLKFAKDHRYSRHLVISPGIYQNAVSNTIIQIRMTRERTTAGVQADGVCMYSYAIQTTEKLPREVFTAAVTQPSKYDSSSVSVFAQPVPTPDMPWKRKPVNGHLKGFVSGGDLTNTLDGATITVTGPKKRNLTSDATGFYGAVDLPPGTYTIVTSFPEYASATNTCGVVAGKVTTQDVLLGAATPNSRH
jgi:uncharacterized lipoprotein YddW (UPF0748 family)